MTPPQSHSPTALREDALRIWQAGVAAVAADRLVSQSIAIEGDELAICGQRWNLAEGGQVCVVGGGKAGTGMALGLERALPDKWHDRLSGWLNVPDNCLRPTRRIHLHPARPAGVNEPTPEGVWGTEQILDMVSQLGPHDLCLVLLSGGGSALLPAPCTGITLAEKQAVTRFLMRSGATIGELNTVRRQLSRIKGGGLVRACRAGRMIALIISDVIGDPLEVIASGPTVPIAESPQLALEVLRKFDPRGEHVPSAVIQLLQSRLETNSLDVGSVPQPIVSNHIIGNNETAVAAAALKATRLGYEVVERESDRGGVAREVGRELAQWAQGMRAALLAGKRVCRLSGGEPIVRLREAGPDHPQQGGRNQELVLAAAEELWAQEGGGIVILSGGTDGEDGPTDAAGAYVDGEVLEQARRLGLHPQPFLEWNNSYPFFAAAGGHLKTGPTFTNVMDLRVVLVEGSPSPARN